MMLEGHWVNFSVLACIATITAWTKCIPINRSNQIFSGIYTKKLAVQLCLALVGVYGVKEPCQRFLLPLLIV